MSLVSGSDLTKAARTCQPAMGFALSSTKKLIALAGEHGISLQNALDHFDYGLPKQPLQKRAASTRAAGRKVQGRVMKFEHTDLSQKLESDVRELNEYLAKQSFGGGCVHQGYVRIFQNGDDRHFNWDRGGRLYSQPPTTNSRARRSVLR